ncbi:hypothetical protein [Streptomyces sp. NRRL F-5135]|uniref:hypothetical protein n=1 Tax=Streptomyces sp. NRRL F-5135 TaxID=1463858 RepID=UPI0004C79D69|nr:hypothetical protein [Streptomyces sp. NRRL F-5135]
MSKPGKARYRLSAVKASYAEAVGGEFVEVETDDGKIYTFPHPMFTSDEFGAQVDAAKGNEDTGKILLGDQWDAFVKSGGDAQSLMLVYVAARNEMQDTVGKHKPPRA